MAYFVSVLAIAAVTLAVVLAPISYALSRLEEQNPSDIYYAVLSRFGLGKKQQLTSRFYLSGNLANPQLATRTRIIVIRNQAAQVAFQGTPHPPQLTSTSGHVLRAAA